MEYAIGIRFPDNDFGKTFKGFLEIFYLAATYDPERILNLNKSEIKALFKSLAAPVLYLFQREELVSNFAERYSIYLDLKDIYMDQEVVDYLCEVKATRNCNNEFHWLDLKTGRIESV